MEIRMERYVPEQHNKDIFKFNMCLEDRREVELATGKKPYDVLKESLSVSEEAFVAYLGDVPIAYTGVATGLNNDEGIPWLLTSDLSKAVASKDIFCTFAWDLIEEAFTRYDVLHNFVSVEHTKAIRWLKFLGFKFEDSTYILDDPDAEFYHFYWYKGEPYV